MKKLHPTALIEAGATKNAVRYGTAILCLNETDMPPDSNRALLAIVLGWEEADVDEILMNLEKPTKRAVEFIAAAYAFNENGNLSWKERRVLIAKVFGWTETTVDETLAELVQLGFAELYE